MTIIAGTTDAGTFQARPVVEWAAQCFATEVRESHDLAHDLVAATIAVTWILEEHADTLEDEHGGVPCPGPDDVRLVLAYAATLITDLTDRPWCHGWDCRCADNKTGA